MMDKFVEFRGFNLVRERMQSAISVDKTEIQDAVLSDFSEVDHLYIFIGVFLWEVVELLTLLWHSVCHLQGLSCIITSI